jgi:N-glycosylase/DNA lyase
MEPRESTPTGRAAEFRLVGPGGEPVDLVRTFASHGVATLPPMELRDGGRALEMTLAVPGRGPRRVVVAPSTAGFGAMTVAGRAPGSAAMSSLVATVRHVLRLDEDLSGFYALVASDPELAWVAGGAGRMIRSPTVFEDVVKTICTTNCAWSATKRMVGALVEYLGERAPGAPPLGTLGRAFPTPEAMACAGDEFYRDVARAGYRGAYLKSLALAVTEGSIDLESLGASSGSFSDDEVADRLLALPGVGPYAAAHIMMLLGRYSRLILDSWTRPTYARIAGRRTSTDAHIERRFRRYGRYAGLAFWLYLTRDWIEDADEGS